MLEKRSTKKKILFIGDDRRCWNYAGTLFQCGCYFISIATSAEAGAELQKQMRFDIVINAATNENGWKSDG